MTIDLQEEATVRRAASAFADRPFYDIMRGEPVPGETSQDIALLGSEKVLDTIRFYGEEELLKKFAVPDRAFISQCYRQALKQALAKSEAD